MEAKNKSRSSRRSKAKGREGENEIASLLSKSGIPAERVPLSGSLKGKYRGDVWLSDTGDRAEVKRRKKAIQLIETWLKQADNSGCSIIFFREDRGNWKVIMNLETFLEIYPGRDQVDTKDL